MLYAAKSHIGLVRTMNQDDYVIVPQVGFGDLYLVADGMGGPSAGDVASQLAVEAVRNYIQTEIQPESADLSQILLDAIHHANEIIYQQALGNPSFQGMGTTVVCALANGNTVNIGHVGDSRAYALLGETFRQVTKDHSLVAELVRNGQLTEEEAKTHPQRNIVTRSVGTEPRSIPDLDTITWTADDVIMLCSDGLTNFVTTEQLALFMRQARQCEDVESLEDILDSMIQCALDGGGTDNVTALVAINREERGQS